MDDIVAFLNDRLADDTTAIAKHPDGEDDWPGHYLVATAESSYPCFPYLQIHKQRALAEVDAKRRIIVRCEEEMLSGIPRLIHFCQQTLWEMAKPYATHPAFKEEWRP